MGAEQRIPSPLGYGPVTLLDKIRHSGLSLPATQNYSWSASLNAVQLHAQEMGKAALSHPVAFTRLSSAGAFVPVAVLGLREGQNLCVDSEGQWLKGSYIPAYIRCHPFCIARTKKANGTSRGLVCVDESVLVKGAPELFDAAGNATAAWQPVQALLDAAESAVPQTEAFARRLAALGLFEPFEALVMPKNGEQLRLKGLWRVNETRLATLPASVLRTLIKQGELRAIHAHILSLEHFARLMVAGAATAP